MSTSDRELGQAACSLATAILDAGSLTGDARNKSGVVLEQELKRFARTVIQASRESRPIFQLPNGQWVAPDRVSSVRVVCPENAPPCVVIDTKDGANIVVENPGSFSDANAMRDEIAARIRE
jgi:hypothetical protein